MAELKSSGKYVAKNSGLPEKYRCCMSVVGFSELNVAYGHEDSLVISQL